MFAWAQWLIRMVRSVRVPGMPAVPGFLARLALAKPRLVPCWMRWRVTTAGLGIVIADLMRSGDSSTPEVLEELGWRQGTYIRERLRYGRTPEECARAVALANRLFHIKASVQVEGKDRALLVTPGCPWSRNDWWGPQACGPHQSLRDQGQPGVTNKARSSPSTCTLALMCNN